MSQLYIHPSQLKLTLDIKIKEYELLEKDASIANDMISEAIKRMTTQKDKSSIKKMSNTYQKMIVELENKKQEIIKLQKQLEVSTSLYEQDDNVFEYLENAKASAMVEGYKQTQEKKKEIMSKYFAVEKIIESCRETLLMEKTVGKKTKKKFSEAEELLELVNMTPEQRLDYARKKRVSILKKTSLGAVGISAVGSFFFPPMLTVTAPIFATGALGFLGLKFGSKIKPVAKLIDGAKEDLRLTKKALQEYAYPKQLAQSQQNFNQQQNQEDIYGDFR